MLNEERKSLNKTKMLSVWSGKMQQQKSVTKFGVTNLSIQIVICQDVASLSFSKNIYAPSYNGSCWPHHQVRSLVGWQGTSARLATLTKLRPFLERQLLFLFNCSNRQCSLRGRVPDLVSLLVAYAEQVLQP